MTKTTEQPRRGHTYAEGILRNVLATSIVTDEAKEMRVEALAWELGGRIDGMGAEEAGQVAADMLAGFEAGFDAGHDEGMKDGRAIQRAVDSSGVGVSDFERFCRDLAEFACTWVVEIQNKIVAKAREYYADATMRALVARHAEARRRVKRDEAYEFVRACLGEDADRVYGDDTLDKANLEAYARVLNDLVYEQVR